MRPPRSARGLGWSIGVALLLAFGTGPAAAQGRDLLVFAAASLKNALDDVGAEYVRQTGRKVVVSYGASPSLARADNVRAALALVSRGEAPLGIVYQTDASADAKVKVVGFFPEDAHPPIVYPVAALAASTSPATGAYLAFLRSAAARPRFEKQGFTVLE